MCFEKYKDGQSLVYNIILIYIKMIVMRISGYLRIFLASGQ